MPGGRGRPNPEWRYRRKSLQPGCLCRCTCKPAQGHERFHAPVLPHLGCTPGTDHARWRWVWSARLSASSVEDGRDIRERQFSNQTWWHFRFFMLLNRQAARIRKMQVSNKTDQSGLSRALAYDFKPIPRGRLAAWI